MFFLKTVFHADSWFKPNCWWLKCKCILFSFTFILFSFFFSSWLLRQQFFGALLPPAATCSKYIWDVTGNCLELEVNAAGRCCRHKQANENTEYSIQGQVMKLLLGQLDNFKSAFMLDFLRRVVL